MFPQHDSAVLEQTPEGEQEHISSDVTEGVAIAPGVRRRSIPGAVSDDEPSDTLGILSGFSGVPAPTALQLVTFRPADREERRMAGCAACVCLWSTICDPLSVPTARL